ncbi:uncharacterized protein EDB91DRAFT_1242682 [Suillus paluster]|uniref:uncharacterized protein n=1 Tax=Suillus paluster TaxID=48578 RepID=UPI001B8679D8|nr:uncharacterized protein EDB91DRAFT_1242682 [Suillus paluster]KAG1753710.1 hypothetical protein EDB91DRAFT_1242682 [Suillus paluster]
MGAVDDTFGAFLIGVVISATLYGVTFVQTWYYFSRYSSDPWYMKLLVGAILLSDTVHQALITHTVYTYLITDFDIPANLGKLVWSLSVEVLFNGFTGLLVQSFLTARVYRLSNKSIIATATVLSLVIAEFVIIVVYVAKAVRLTTFVEVPQLKPLSMCVNAVAAAGDVLIAGFLCVLLQRARTGFRRSDTMINKLILFTINTGLLTSICAVMSLISITMWPNSYIYMAFYFCLGRLYCNCLLATLNARKGLRRESQDEHMGLSLRGVQKSADSPIGPLRRGMPNDISIKIDTTRDYVEDEYSPARDKCAQSV